MHWQYGVSYIEVIEKERFKNLKFILTSEKLRNILDAWGEKGWELVSIFPLSTWHRGDIGEEIASTLTAVFKRPSASAGEG